MVFCDIDDDLDELCGEGYASPGQSVELDGYMADPIMEREETQGLVHAPVPIVGETEEDEEYDEDNGTRVVALCKVPYSKTKSIENGEDEGNVQNLARESTKEDEEAECEDESASSG